MYIYQWVGGFERGRDLLSDEVGICISPSLQLVYVNVHVVDLLFIDGVVS